MLARMAGPFVTIVFAQLTGTAALLEREGDEAADASRRAGLETLRVVLARHGGEEVRSTGDGLMAAFPSAVSAVTCAVDMQRAAEDAGSLALRVGLDAGEPPPGEGDPYGLPVVVAERLSEMAEPGQILVSEVVRRVAGPRTGEAMRPVGALRLRGVAERVAATEVVWREDPADLPPEPEPMREITVVVADDQRLVRSGFRVILDDEPDMRVVGEAADGRTAVDVVRRRRPDVVLMDIRMPELDGLRAAGEILTGPPPHPAVLMLTTFDRDEYVYEALRVGASGFLLKDAPADRLLDAVRVAAAGDALLAPSVTRRLIADFARSSRPAPGAVPDALSELTERELEVLRLMARGLSNSEIAAELVLGENTIKTHVARVLRKLGLRDRVQAVVLAYESGLVAPDAGD